MNYWELVEDKYFVNVDNITFINCSNEGEFTVGFVGGGSQSFTTESSQKKFAQAIRNQLGAVDFKEKEEEEIADSEKLPESTPAWRTV